ncbi:MAG: primosomal protein N', partial [Pseudomonadota bacterium]|nr:primosomal protein N' [Pseudomonadota bacterium]
PDGMTVVSGSWVRVPLGGSHVLGVVRGPGKESISPAKLKPLDHVYDRPAASETHLRFIDWVADYCMATRGAVLKMSMPVPEALETPPPVLRFRLAPPLEQTPSIRLTDARRHVLEVAAAGPALTRTELAKAAGCSPSVVGGLIEAGLLESAPSSRAECAAHYRFDPAAITLSPMQAEAEHVIETNVRSASYQCLLLDGVTGSGKTEVYFGAIAAALEMGKQVLVLLPEIALSAQFFDRFERRFGAPGHLWHSELGTTERKRTWRAVADGTARVVIGARSALFLPFAELGLIVVDEEHETAYKQEEGVVYHARDMAIVRAWIGDFPILLVSATPSLESWVNATQGRYTRLHLPDRYGGARMPDITLIDLRDQKMPASQFISDPLRLAIRQTLDAGEQVLLFLNRRGFAPLTLCRACGHRMACPNCTAWLVTHQRIGRLLCHHCGHAIPMPRVCPACEAEDMLVPCGPGVERIAQELREMASNVRMAELTSDTVSDPRVLRRVIEQIETHEIDAVIGTQIIAKGHHFPMLTLVGVIDADLGLDGGDPRAGERTFQLLQQVSGRAGREKAAGRVLIQTSRPDSAVMRALEAGDRDRFLQIEIENRERYGQPPFGRLAALILSGPDEVMVDRAAADLAGKAPRYKDVRILGPAPAALAILRGRYRRRFLIKGPKTAKLQAVIADWTGRVKLPSSLKLQIDIDPVSFL